MKKTLRIATLVFFGILWGLASVLTALAVWYRKNISVSFEDLLFTLMSPIEGTGTSVIFDIIIGVLPLALMLIAAYIATMIIIRKSYVSSKALRRITAAVCVTALVFSSVFTAFSLRIPEYFATRETGTGEIYEKYYVDPNTVSISADGETNNLIYIYLESMEITYFDEADGGSQTGKKYLPTLTGLARENISFSDKAEAGKLGGYINTYGTSWTMGALLGTTSGVPFSLSVLGDESNNALGADGSFLNGITTLGEILDSKGYKQEFLCGSDASFAGRDTYFTVHGNYEIFDYYTALEKGYITEHNGGWGVDDAVLFEIAKDEVARLAESNQPFNLTMLTVDTHFPGAQRCSRCGYEYDTDLENVLVCQDSLVDEFIEWCNAQPFMENTTVIITGDHPRMDSELVDGVDWLERTIYNCFINPVAEPYFVLERTFTPLDMFPTVLSAIGFKIDGERLGLGTNLFSPAPTLAEKYGFEWLNSELRKYSAYYEKEFALKTPSTQ